jgi:hypothetical protein
VTSGADERSHAENGSVDCLSTIAVPHEYFGLTGWTHAYLNDPDGHEVSLYSAGQKRLKRS